MAVPETDVWLVDLGPVLCQAGANPAMVKRNLRETGVNVYNHVERAAGVTASTWSRPLRDSGTCDVTKAR
jgi:hypothetical protein